MGLPRPSSSAVCFADEDDVADEKEAPEDDDVSDAPADRVFCASVFCSGESAAGAGESGGSVSSSVATK